VTTTDASGHWRRVWRTRDEREVSWFETDLAVSLALIEAAGPRPEDPVIDVGGGASRLVDRLLDRGFRDVTVLDVAAEALARARARLGPRAAAVDWIVADIRRFRPARRWRLWHDRAVFHFLVEPEDREAYLAALRAGTGAGAWLVIATFAPDAPPRCSGLPVARYDADALAAVFAPDFRPVQRMRQLHRTPAGEVRPFTWLRLQRVTPAP